MDIRALPKQPYIPRKDVIKCGKGTCGKSNCFTQIKTDKTTSILKDEVPKAPVLKKESENQE
jgi:hypothetical protein